MRRVFYLLVTVAIASSTVARPSIHVHAYAGHGHAEHDHGPASHEHTRRAPTHGAGAHVASCDPGAHAVFLATVTKACRLGVAFAPALEIGAAYELSGDSASRISRMPVDPRQHGPPHLVSLPPRAPPSLATT